MGRGPERKEAAGAGGVLEAQDQKEHVGLGKTGFTSSLDHICATALLALRLLPSAKCLLKAHPQGGQLTLLGLASATRPSPVPQQPGLQL